MDKLPVLQKLASTKGSLARIFKAISDPPTTSLQRLKVVYLLSVIIVFGSCYEVSSPTLNKLSLRLDDNEIIIERSHLCEILFSGSNFNIENL